MKGYEKAIKEKLGAIGWKFLRQGKGSHEIWSDPPGTFSVTIPKDCKSRFLANKILKEAGIDEKF